HQHPAAARVGMPAGLGQTGQDRQRKGGGLAGGGLRNAEGIAGGGHFWDGLGVDWGGGGVALVGQGAGGGLSEAKGGKGAQSIVLSYGENRPASTARGRESREPEDTPRGLGCRCFRAGCDGSKTKTSKPRRGIQTWNSRTRPAKASDTR